MQKLLKECWEKISSLIINRIIELVFTTNIIVLIFSYIFNWHFIGSVFQRLFLFFTLFLGVVLIFKWILFIEEQKTIKEEYLALASGKNWDLMFDEKVILGELIRRDLKIFEYEMIDASLISEYMEDIQMNYDPDLPVMTLLDRTYNRLQERNWQNTIINNLLNHKFIIEMPNRVRIYKINDAIWDYEQKEKEKTAKEKCKEQKEMYRHLRKKKKPKLIYTKYENEHKVIGFFGIRIKVRVCDKDKEFEL